MIEIAIGLGENKNVLKAMNLFKSNHSDCNIKAINNEEELLRVLKDKSVDGVIRGSLPSSKIMKNIKELNPQNKVLRATYVNGKEYEFLLSPVGIDEGITIEEKCKIAINCAEFLKKLSKTPKIAILANGRKGDYGRSKEINKSIDESEELVQLIENQSDYMVKNYYILLEQAIRDKYNVIIAPDGIIGNIIFRTLVLLNSWPSYGAITFGIDGIYIDTSRDQSVDGYLRSIDLAYRLAKFQAE